MMRTDRKSSYPWCAQNIIGNTHVGTQNTKYAYPQIKKRRNGVSRNVCQCKLGVYLYAACIVIGRNIIYSSPEGAYRRIIYTQPPDYRTARKVEIVVVIQGFNVSRRSSCYFQGNIRSRNQVVILDIDVVVGSTSSNTQSIVTGAVSKQVIVIN